MAIDFKTAFAGTCNARFFRLSRKPTRAALKAVLDAAAGAKTKIRFEGFSRKLPSQFDGTYSFYIFERRSKVTFLPEYDFKEVHFGFILFVQFDDYVAVFSSRTRVFDDKIEVFATQIDINKILASVVRKSADLRKLRAQSFSSGTAGCHSKTYEGVSLQSALGSLSNGRHLIRSLSTKSKGQVHSLNLDLRKVARYGSRTRLSALVEWCSEVIQLIEVGMADDEFISTFAEITALENAGEPNAIIFHTWELEHLLGDRFETDTVSLNLPRRSILSLSPEKADRYVRATTNILEARYQLAKVKDRKEWSIMQDLDDDNVRPIGTLTLDNGKFRFKSKRLNNLILRSEETVERIPEVISRGHLFSISFSDPQYFYSAGMTVLDRKIQQTAQYLTNFIQVHPELEHISDEKGNTSTDGKFTEGSIFRYIDEHLSTRPGLLVCEDLGPEWADFLHFEGGNQPRLRFLHAKHKSSSVGATPFHDIVSQALKNLGHVCRSASNYERKLVTKWSGAHGDLAVARIRSLVDFESAEECIQKVVGSAFVERSVVLVVSFFSKADFENQIQELNTAENHICQRVWLLSSFVSSCLELGIRPEVWCAP